MSGHESSALERRSLVDALCENDEGFAVLGCVGRDLASSVEAYHVAGFESVRFAVEVEIKDSGLEQQNDPPVGMGVRVDPLACVERETDDGRFAGLERTGVGGRWQLRECGLLWHARHSWRRPPQGFPECLPASGRHDRRSAWESGVDERGPMMFSRVFLLVAHVLWMMPKEGTIAPTFAATVGTSDHEPFDLEDHLGDGPVVLAFFPGSFTPPCANEMVSLQERLAEFRDAGATVFGISADSPFSQGAFREEHGLEFDLISDMGGEAIEAYDLEIDIPELGLHDIANRAVFVLDGDGTITYGWVAEDPTNEPDYAEILDAVATA